MEFVIWAFGGLAAVVGVIIGVAAWIVFWRDRDANNTRVRHKRRPGKAPKFDAGKGVPRSR